MLAIFITILGLHQLSEALNTTTEIQRCHFGDSKCIVESMNQVIRGFPRGLPALGIMPLDVVDVKDYEIWNKSEVSGVYFQFRMYDQVNYGFENTTITEVRGFNRDPTSSSVEIHGQIPSLVHKCKYMVNGKLLFFEMNSQGESMSDFQNFRFFLKLKVLIEYRNNKRYLKVYELVPRVKLDSWTIWLDDFFPVNSDLTILVNQVINENWVEFWNELEPSILAIFQTVFLDLIMDTFQKIPYDDLFLNK